MKIDATVNMYHHFCDFLNLYSSLLLNSTLDPDLAFTRDIRVLIWENQAYRSAFEPVFNAFTRYPILNLADFAGQKVCFEKAVFPLLPRMLFGLYYNTPFANDLCSGSRLFKAFSEFIPYRLGIDLPTVTSRRLKVTILNRKTPYRNIVNLQEMVDVLLPNYDVTVANFTHQRPPYKHQMAAIRQTDILVGLHGAGLTHMLFLPDWAVVFELYDCQDPECYRDLARLRGLKHMTWTEVDKMSGVPSKHDPSYDIGTARAKFQDYFFDPEAFSRRIEEARRYVVNHPVFKSKLIKDEL